MANRRPVVVRPGWAPDDVDLDRPSPARIYDYLLGGSHNLAADRAVAEELIKSMPDAPAGARANRAFLYRAVRYLVGAGVRQFLDLGSGIPTAGNVHEVAQRAAADATVVYVDMDPVAVAHSRALLADNPNATVIQADVRAGGAMLDRPEVGDLLDLSRPVAVLMVALLHAIPDSDDPWAIVAGLRDRLPSGSYLAIGHGTADSRPEETKVAVELSRRTATPMTTRTHADVLRFFAGFDLVAPGLVYVPAWHPDPGTEDPHPERAANYGGVGVKP
jgi:SAM-dependent methyltransferase